jgi:hypothetical protein
MSQFLPRRETVKRNAHAKKIVVAYDPRESTMNVLEAEVSGELCADCSNVWAYTFFFFLLWIGFVSSSFAVFCACHCKAKLVSHKLGRPKTSSSRPVPDILLPAKR